MEHFLEGSAPLRLWKRYLRREDLCICNSSHLGPSKKYLKRAISLSKS